MASRTVKVVSKKHVKPSNPTPSDLGILNLSLFDQIAPRIYTDVIFYYLGSEDGGSRAESAKRMAQLEKSLSQTLTFFYPLAGRFMEKDFSIDCGDQGVEYFEAQVNGKLEEFLQEPEIEDLNKFLPWNSPPAANLASSPLLAIQINSFDCGGIVLGISISHILADGSSIFRFINEWATNNRRGIHPMLCPSLSYSQFASCFPARQSLSGTKLTLVRSSKAPQPAEDGGGKLVARKFFLDEKVISNIRDQAASFLNYKPTRVMVAIALLWKALMCVSKAKHGYLRNSVISLAMNLRGKQSLKLPELNYGNFWVPVPVSFVAGENKIELQNLITLLGDTIRDTKEKLVNASSEDISSMLINFRVELVEKRQQTDAWDSYIFSSWCNFPLYEADFGWAKPFSVSCPATQSLKINWLMDARNGGGIEAWINLKEKDMLELEKDPDIQALVPKQ